jgi:hypothetical protein
MIPGGVYRVVWFESRDYTPGLSTARMRFEGEHPSGCVVFAYVDGFAMIAVAAAAVLGADLVSERAS